MEYALLDPKAGALLIGMLVGLGVITVALVIAFLTEASTRRAVRKEQLDALRARIRRLEFSEMVRNKSDEP